MSFFKWLTIVPSEHVIQNDLSAAFIYDLAIAWPPKDLASLKAASDLVERSTVPTKVAPRYASFMSYFGARAALP